MSYMMEKMKLSVITGLVDGISIQFSGEYTTIEQVYHNFLQKQWVYTTSVSQITQFIHLNLFWIQFIEFKLYYRRLMGDWSSQQIITVQNNQELYAIVQCLQP